MARIDFADILNAVGAARHRARRLDHVQRAQHMLLAAALTSAAIVAVAGVLLARLL